MFGVAANAGFHYVPVRPTLNIFIVGRLCGCVRVYGGAVLAWVGGLVMMADAGQRIMCVSCVRSGFQ